MNAEKDLENLVEFESISAGEVVDIMLKPKSGLTPDNEIRLHKDLPSKSYPVTEVWPVTKVAGYVQRCDLEQIELGIIQGHGYGSITVMREAIKEIHYEPVNECSKS